MLQVSQLSEAPLSCSVEAKFPWMLVLRMMWSGASLLVPPERSDAQNRCAGVTHTRLSVSSVALTVDQLV